MVTLLAALVGVAYLVGWRTSLSYFRAVDAEWVASLLSPIELLERGEAALAALVGGTLLAMALFADGKWGGGKWQLGFEIIADLVGIVLVAIGVVFESSLRVTATKVLVQLGTALVGFSLSMDLGRYVFTASGERKWRPKGLWMVWGLWGTLIIYFPQVVGRAEGRLAVDPLRSTLPVVRVDNQDWKLLLPRSERFLLLRKEIGKFPRIKIVPVEKIDYVGSREVGNGAAAVGERTPQDSP